MTMPRLSLTSLPPAVIRVIASHLELQDRVYLNAVSCQLYDREFATQLASIAMQRAMDAILLDMAHCSALTVKVMRLHLDIAIATASRRAISVCLAKSAKDRTAFVSNFQHMPHQLCVTSIDMAISKTASALKNMVGVQGSHHGQN